MSENKQEPDRQTFSSRWESGALQFSRLAALLSMVFGALVTAGWCLHQPGLTTPIPGHVPVALTTGISFLAAGLALLLLTLASSHTIWSRIAVTLLSLLPLGIGLSISAYYMRASSFDLDHLAVGRLAHDVVATGHGRMAPHTAISFVACGLALLFGQNKEKFLRNLSQSFSVTVFGIGMAVLCGYTYGTPLLYSIGSFTPVSLLTGVAFVNLGLGLFFSHPASGLAAVVTDKGLGGKTARVLLPVALLAPVALGYLRMWGQAHDWYALQIDTSVIVLLMAGTFSLIVLWHCHFLSRITRRERAALDALQHNRERTRLIIDRAYDAFIAIDSEGKIIEWNLEAERIFGWEREESLGKNLTECIIPLEFRKAHDMGLHRFSSAGGGKILNKRIQLIAQRQGGEQFPIELAVFPVEFEGQTTFCAFIQDITDRKRIESKVELLNGQLIQARDQALEGSRLKSEFLANMSHEIRTPMNAVIGLSDLLRRTPLSRDQKKFVDLIVTSGQSLLQIIDDILVFSKIEAGRLDLELSDFDLVATVEGAADLLADRAREKKVSLTTFLEPDIPQRVRGDGQRLKQVLLNLLSNAIKFTEQGRIQVRATLESTTEKNVIVSFSVQDTGIGISEDGLKVLFTPFTQVDGSSTRRHGGTGLGLTISKRMVELMGGTISVESIEGEGSTFTFNIPFAHAQSEYDRPTYIAGLESVRMMMVGLQDQEATVLESYVESWGLRSSIANYCEEASLELSHAIREGDPYQIVLLDSQMTEEDPFQFVRRLRDITHVSNTKLLLLLSIDDIGQADKAIQGGFDGTITRPVKQSSLFNTLLGLFETRSSSNQSDTLELRTAGEPPSTQFVLVAEDNMINQEVAVLLLQELGFNAHVVANGKAALEASIDPNCRLILMDCQMPEMDGFEATMLIRQREKHKGEHIPIVAMTAHAMEGDRELCLQAGMDDYVSKPVTILRLREVMHRWADYRQSHKRVTQTSLPALEKPATLGAPHIMQERSSTPKETKSTDSASSVPPSVKPSSTPPLTSAPDVSKAQTESSNVLQPAADASAPRVQPSSTPPDQSTVANPASGLVIASDMMRAKIDQEITAIDMTPTSYEDELESEREFLGFQPQRRSRCQSDELSRPAEEMLDCAIEDATGTTTQDDIDRVVGSGRPSSKTVPSFRQMSPQQAISEVDSILKSRDFSPNATDDDEVPSPLVATARKRYLSNTVNDIDVSNLFDYNALESTFGAQSAKKFLNLFATMTPSLLSRLETAISGKHFEAAKEAAHELKGMCATIHIPCMVDLCRGIEESANTSDWSNAETLLLDLKQTFNAAESSIKKL